MSATANPVLGGPRAAAGAPGWARLIRHSHRLGLRWLAGAARNRLAGARVGLVRLLVPLDPWRFYEMGRIADETFAGRCLDVSSPKLLPSLLQAEGQGEWVCVDLFGEELERWRAIDPRLDLCLADARSLPFEDDAFSNILCVSVIEHVGDGGDASAMAEFWRVLRPGGTLHLTTNVASRATDVIVKDRIYGDASSEHGEGYFFERRYDAGALDQRLLQLPWTVATREYVRQIDSRPHDLLAEWAPYSYAFGFALSFFCPQNFARISDPAELLANEHGVVYLKLRKPA